MPIRSRHTHVQPGFLPDQLQIPVGGLTGHQIAAGGRADKTCLQKLGHISLIHASHSHKLRLRKRPLQTFNIRHSKGIGREQLETPDASVKRLLNVSRCQDARQNLHAL